MRTGGGSRRGEGRTANRGERLQRAVLALLLVVAAVGCSTADDPPPEQRRASAALEKEVARLLDARAAAVRERRMSDFLDGLAPGRKRLARKQRRYFLNLEELPLRRYGYAVSPGSTVVDEGGTVHAVVTVRMQLAGFDRVPVERLRRFAFVREQGGKLRLASVRDRAFESENEVRLAPWDLTRIQVVTSARVLGVFDDQSIHEASQIVSSVEEGISQVSAEVPVRWSGKVVVYALSGTRFLGALGDLPGGDPDQLDGVAFPVPGDPHSQRLAGTRFLLHPRMIEEDSASRDRLIRHELTHVALGKRDDVVPTWLAEGIAEYVSVQAIPTWERLIARDAVTAARDGLSELPPDDTFNGPDSTANYGIAWYACEYIVAGYGEEVLWRLFRAMRRHGTTYAEQDRVLEQVLGIDGAQLADGAARKMLATFH